jgi:hypothetical protein
MKSSKKYFFVLLALLLITVPAISHAVLPGETDHATGFQLKLTNPLKVDTVIDLLKALLGILIQIGLPIAAMAIIYSGFLMVTAQGNEEKLTKAKTAFIYAVLGTLILMGAWVIITAIQGTVSALQ